MHKFLLLLIIATMAATFYAQEGKQNDALTKRGKTRPPAYAGSFYASDPADLTRDLEFLFSHALPSKTKGTLLAVIAPHAGYPYSGEVAATSYKQADPKKNYKNIFLLGNSHRFAFPGAAIYASGNYQTPLGEVKVNTELANELIEENDVFIEHNRAHLEEHSLEVQLPFLQFYMEKDFQIVPILLGTSSESFARKLAGVLKPYLNEDNLFIISADFSHYPEYSNANTVDMNTARAICSNDVAHFLTALKQNEEKNIPNLATSACAWPSILTLLHMTQDDREHLKYELIRYQNSGDTRMGDRSRVVGYCSIAVSTQDSKNTQKQNKFMLSNEDKKTLLEIARITMDSYIRKGTIYSIDQNTYSNSLQTHTGAFVTLHKNGKLRGCIGRFQPDKPLCEVVRDMAISASTKDYRFKPVEPGELDDIDLEISVLTPLEQITDPEEINLGQHGIYIKKGSSSGTFLPQVATETGWNLEEFLGHCARDKAGIGWDGWKEADLYIYEAVIFTEKDIHHK